ncbi:hypothetical protein HNR62_002763 [Oceanisphaera litoralis]|nr:hypothetical protein [Oceanisphaera litoralis]
MKRTPTTHVADGPNQLWCWDITWLPTTLRGRYFYWYMIKGVYSRKLIANEVHECESAEQAAQLLRQASLREQLAGRPLVLHSDNGSAMKGSTMLAAMCLACHCVTCISDEVMISPLNRWPLKVCHYSLQVHWHASQLPYYHRCHHLIYKFTLVENRSLIMFTYMY